MTVHDINNLEIVANHRVNATTNDENAETELVNMDNVNMAKIENDNNDEVAKSDNNDDNPTMSDKKSPLESPAKEKDEEGENRRSTFTSHLWQINK